MGDNINIEIVLAGAAAAFTVDLLIYPLDTLKTRIQSPGYRDNYAASATKKPPSFAAFRGLYQGVGSVIITTLPAAGVFFTVYESSKRILAATASSSIPQSVVHSLASTVAELSSCLVLTPGEVIKQNAQVSRQSGRGVSTSLEAFRVLRRAEGGVSRQLLTGYTALVARNLPFTALNFPIFEAVRTWIWKRRDASVGGNHVGGRVSKWERGLLETAGVNGTAACASGGFAAFVTTPFDVVKTRIMLMAGEKSNSTDADSGKTSRTGTRRASGLHMAGKIYREKGILGLFRGGLLRSTWTAPGSGLYLGTYEMSKVWLTGRKHG